MRHHFFSFVFVLFSLILPAFPSGGVLADSSLPLHVIRTEFFDIIFPEECADSAKKIEAVCDDYYLEITRLLETDAYQRFPVTITRSVEVLNAYYAAVPYNRIVLFDTLPSTSLDMYEDTIQSVFYHELTHAVTYNMKASVLRKFSFIADCLNPAWLSITTFWAEGATVSFESKGRGGRLNDPFSTQIVNQSKIESRFPGWRDVTGARDTYPGGTDAYMFGSMFACYLQETYGMSKYAEFWKNAGSRLTPSFVAGVFEKTYGMSIGSAWDDFEKTLDVRSAEKNAAVLSQKKSIVSTFDVFFDRENMETKIAYFDSASSALRLLLLDSDGRVKKNKKLLSVTNLTRLAFSPDGEKLALSRNIEKKNSKSVLAVYDIKKGKYVQHNESGVRDSFFAWSKENPSLECVRFEGGKAAFSSPLLLKADEVPFSPVFVDENLCASIVKDGLSWKIRFFDAEKVLCEYDFSSIPGAEGAEPGSLILHRLHAVDSDSDSIFLSFSWAQLGMGGKMLSRAGFLKIKRDSWRAEAFLQKENSFAGVTDCLPAFSAAECLSTDPLNSSDDEKSFPLYAIFAEYEQNPLCQLEMKPSDFENVEIAPNIFDRAKPQISSSEKKSDGQVISGKESYEISYNPFRYYRRGIFLPLLGIVESYSHDFKKDSSTIPGLTFASTNPWGDRRFDFSAGYDPFYNLAGLKTQFSGGDNSFKHSLTGTCLFDKDGFMQNYDSLQLTKYLWRGKVSYFAVGSQGSFLYGRQIVDAKLSRGRDDSIGKSLDALAFVQFSNVHKVSPEPYYSAGFLLQPFILASWRDSENRISAEKYVNAGAKAQLRFPIFIPFIFTAQLFPNKDYAASASLTAILADFEIHKGIPAISLFIQRIVLSASYSGKLSYNHDELWDINRTGEILKNAKKSDYSDAIVLSGDLYLSPNTGFFTNGNYSFSLGYSVIYRPNPTKKENRLAYGITFSMDY